MWLTLFAAPFYPNSGSVLPETVQNKSKDEATETWIQPSVICTLLVHYQHEVCTTKQNHRRYFLGPISDTGIFFRWEMTSHLSPKNLMVFLLCTHSCYNNAIKCCVVIKDAPTSQCRDGAELRSPMSSSQAPFLKHTQKFSALPACAQPCAWLSILCKSLQIPSFSGEIKLAEMKAFGFFFLKKSLSQMLAAGDRSK